MKTPEKLIHKKRFWASLWLAQFFIFYLLSKMDRAVFFFEKIFIETQNVRVNAFKNIFFSIGDVLYILSGIFLAITCLFLWKRNARKKIWIGLLMGINVLYFIYQLFWGMMYFQQPLLSRDKIKPLDTEQLKPLAEYYLQKCWTLRKRNPDKIYRLNSTTTLEQEIKRQQQAIARQYGKGDSIQICFKPSLYGRLMNYTGILGYYNPFTSESQYNPYLPDIQIPFTLAHETSHQIGFAREEEANFIGFLIGENSTDENLKYSAYWFAFKTILYNISRKDKNYSLQILKNLPKPLLNDYKAEVKFYREHQGRIQKFFSLTNNLFLKSNRQDGSISYNYFIYLLMDYHKEKGLHLKMQSQKHK
ncbi:DUF3810 family protein [Elizabethkingia argentiflava]|uniref:DUF3810 family protein n=1 Tax=Elizabethkingia argenteiflava TaxID=2681556 RepID=A0A845PZH4_9FLAO|nr:DUF3810 domain-containing protein [Elizabethkingia argenteiflava]NAW51480.1 DUF3810 family protein [Elizabethkingia argenteiflava]